MSRRDPEPFALSRRRLLLGLGAAGAVYWLDGGAGAWAACERTPRATAGPFWVDERLHRSDLRVDPSDGAPTPGVPLALAIRVLRADAECAPAAAAQVDVWHCNAAGRYSDEASNGTAGKKFLRGYQLTDANGTVRFTTVYPGWYPGRTIHVHVRVRAAGGTDFTTQLYFDDAESTQILASHAAYAQRGRDTFNADDGLYLAATQLALAPDGSGGYRTTATIAI